MNYGKKSTRKRDEELTSKGTMIRKKFSVIFCKALLICFFAVLVVGGSAAFGVIQGIIASAPSIDDIDATPTGYQTAVLDSQGNQIATLVSSGSNRKFVTIDEIPLDLQHAFVAIEDSRFYEQTVLISRESSVPVSRELHRAFIFQKVQVPSPSSF